MPRIYRTREGDITSVDTKTQLATEGSNSAPGPLLVPNNARRLVGVIVAGISDLAAAADAVHFIRLEGPGLLEGPESIALGGEGAQQATGGQLGRTAYMFPLDVGVQANQEILVFGETAGEDMGQATLSATLVFEVS